MKANKPITEMKEETPKSTQPTSACQIFKSLMLNNQSPSRDALSKVEIACEQDYVANPLNNHRIQYPQPGIDYKDSPCEILSTSMNNSYICIEEEQTESFVPRKDFEGLSETNNRLKKACNIELAKQLTEMRQHCQLWQARKLTQPPTDEQTSHHKSTKSL